MNRLDTFIADIYRAVQFRGTDSFRESTLRSLGVLVPFDGAIWGSGNRDEEIFHSIALLGAPEELPGLLEETSQIDPILPELLDNLGTAVRMSDVVSDNEFFKSEVYRRCFSRFGVERVMAYVDFDPRSKIYTLMGLGRIVRDNDFTADERVIFERTAYHMINSARNAFFLHLANETGADPEVAAAICDNHGLFYETQGVFLDLLEQHFPNWKGEELPFEIPAAGETVNVKGLCVSAEAYGDLYCLRLWEERPTDALSKQDRMIVDAVAKGMTFKEIGRNMNMAPSTIANRLYRIYRILGVTSRTSLARLVHGETLVAAQGERT